MFNIESFDAKEANDGGEWVEVFSYPGMRVKVRSENYKPYQAALKKLARSYGRRAAQALGTDEFEARRGALLAEHIIVGWEKALRDKDGKEVPFSKETAAHVLKATDPDGAGDTFRGIVTAAANEVADRRLGFAEDAAGN